MAGNGDSMRSILLLILLGLVSTTCGAEPAAQGTIDPNDPLLKAVQELSRDLQQLRQEINSASPGNKTAPPVMSAPSMTAPSMSAPPVRPATSSARPAVASAKPRQAGVDIASPARLAPPKENYDLWSFQPLKKPAVPDVKASTWAKSEIDRHVLSKLETAGVKPNPDADRFTLIRRVSFDLTGLPPTEQEVRAYVNDAATDDVAMARMVDSYLASPRFGERWGRHWLDVVRYADSVGRTWNAPFIYAFRYRDYVIDSFNSDKRYDRFILEQLAGDLLPPGSAAEEREQLTATGFLTLGSLPLNDGSDEGFAMDRIDEQIDVTSRAFLGLTVSCARCHDHKYDPISMRDYYSLAGIFYSTRTYPGQAHRGDMSGGGYVDAEKLVRLPSLTGASPPLVGVHSMTEFQQEWQRVRQNVRYTTHPDLAMGVLDDEIRDCEIRLKGNAYDRDVAPPRGDLHIAGLPALPQIPSNASGRLELARWIASPDHPLTARVMANRVWRHLMGRGLARTVDNFGVNGMEPTNAALLDQLATQLIESGWSTKQLIRSIVLSRVYRTSSAGQKAAQERDPQNDLLWRRELRRLELEAVRDSLLQASGRLELKRPDGIQMYGTGGKGQAATRGLLGIESPYRTVYLPVVRAGLPELYATFDFPDPCQITGDREVTTVAPQALFFMNSDFVVDCARDAADRVLNTANLTDAGRVKLVYGRLFSRYPTAAELQSALDFLSELDASGEKDPELYRWSALMQALMASAEFRYAL